MGGYNVAFTLSGVSLIFAALGVATGTFEPDFLLSLPGRIYPLITREILMAVPLFVFMGVMLEKSRIAEDLLESMGDLFGPIKGGLGVSVIFVGCLTRGLHRYCRGNRRHDGLAVFTDYA